MYLKTVCLVLFLSFSAYGEITVEERLSDEEIEMLDHLPEAKMKSSHIILPNGEIGDDFLLKHDPCFLVKFPGNDKTTNLKAKKLCKKTNP